MDKHLTTFCSSSSSSPSVVATEMEKIIKQQVWSNDCYSFDRLSKSPPSSTTSEKKIEKSSSSSSSTELIPLCGIIISLVFLNFVIILQDFYSSFRCTVSIFKSFLRIIYCIWTAWAARSTASAKPPIEKSCSRNSNNINEAGQIKLPRDQTKINDHRNLSLLELKEVMIEGITLCCEIQENLSADKIAGLFVEEEPSLKEVKEAFDIFDENKDGFIDTKELRNALFSLGFMEASEEDCKTMINGFDDNFDGRIDFNEFIKVMERSFC